MKCANPSCTNTLVYLRGGVLRLLEMEAEPHTRLHGHGDGFPVYRPSARYFWLCAECSEKFVMKRWTPDGVVLEPRRTVEQPVRMEPAKAAGPDPLTVFRRPFGKTAG